MEQVEFLRHGYGYEILMKLPTLACQLGYM